MCMQLNLPRMKQHIQSRIQSANAAQPEAPRLPEAAGGAACLWGFVACQADGVTHAKGGCAGGGGGGRHLGFMGAPSAMGALFITSTGSACAL